MDHSPACSAPLAPDWGTGGVRRGGRWGRVGRMMGMVDGGRRGKGNGE